MMGLFRRRNKQKIELAWQHTEAPPINWWDIPAVTKRWNKLISGDPGTDYYEYFCSKHLAELNGLKALSLACGTGHRELKWAKRGKFHAIHAYDLSGPRIQYAKQKAAEEGLDSIVEYRIGDIYEIDTTPESYDVVFAEQSLHHFSPLRTILLKIKKWLKPSGFLLVNEFVGPTRFQWTDRQLEVVNGLLSILPEKYRVQWGSQSVKRTFERPAIASMIEDDPSEAIESAKILELLHSLFHVVEVRPYGGTILNLLFHNIAHHFLSESDPETAALLQLCFAVEDVLIETGDLPSDFVFAVCKR